MRRTMKRLVSAWAGAALLLSASVAAAQYVDNGDGTVTDQYYALMWEKQSRERAFVLMTWQHAMTEWLTEMNGLVTPESGGVQAPGYAGYSDWRLPNLAELMTLVAMGCPSPLCHDDVLGYTVGGYWTSTGYGTSTSGGPRSRYVVFLTDDLPYPVGDVRRFLDSAAAYQHARAVRGPIMQQPYGPPPEWGSP